jgi:hypothetical protein
MEKRKRGIEASGLKPMKHPRRELCPAVVAARLRMAEARKAAEEHAEIMNFFLAVVPFITAKKKSMIQEENPLVPV